MKIIIAILVIIICFQSESSAWGVTGHRATGHIAEQLLKKRVKKKVRSILDGQSLAEVSTWMDEMRSDSTYNHMADWHWVTIPPGKRYAETEKNPHGDIIEAIERMISSLESGKLTKPQEAEFIKILVHLVGDIHQPLHVGAFDDMGGNKVKVSWFRSDSNLHRVWDSEMIDDTRLSYTELVDFLPNLTNQQVKALQTEDVRSWASESQSYLHNVYEIYDGKLGYQYTFKNYRIVERRLLEAGVRLAGILNRIYG